MQSPLFIPKKCAADFLLLVIHVMGFPQLKRIMKLNPTLKISLVLFLLAVAVILVFQNREVVTTRFLFATISMPRAMLLTLVFSMGVLFGSLLTLLLIRQKKKTAV